MGTLDFYNSNAESYFDSTIHVNMDALYECFLPLIPPKGRILDAGSGSGRDTKAFLDRQYQVTPVEPSGDLAALADRFTGVKSLQLTFQELTFHREFDGVWACASLLHIPRPEITLVLTRLVEALKDGGVMYVSLKEGEGDKYAEDGRFFTYYTINSFRNVLHSIPSLTELRSWRSAEIRSTENDMGWLSFLLRKVDLPPEITTS